MGTPGRRTGRATWAAIAAAAVLWPGVAAADVTAFLGLSPSPTTRLARGLSAGMGLVIVGFEVEVAEVAADLAESSPSLTTGSVNVLLQTPIEVSRAQFYATSGATIYRETLDALAAPHRETHVGVNIGGGAKLRLAGPLKLRLDYRLFRLRGAPLYPTAHRFYAGATLGF